MSKTFLDVISITIASCQLATHSYYHHYLPKMQFDKQLCLAHQSMNFSPVFNVHTKKLPAS